MFICDCSRQRDRRCIPVIWEQRGAPKEEMQGKDQGKTMLGHKHSANDSLEIIKEVL